MATINKLHSGAYRVQVRRKGRYASETFHRREDAWSASRKRPRLSFEFFA